MINENTPAILHFDNLIGHRDLIFNGTQPGYGPLPDLWLYTDMPMSSPSQGATIAVPVGSSAETLRAKLEETRAKFSQPAPHSWGGPEGHDSGTDYQTY